MPEWVRRRLADWLGITRLNDAVSFLLMRDLNLLSAASRGPEGHAALREAFLHLAGVLRPSVFCDVGAFDGTTSVAVRKVAPECEVHAFEANPENHARYVDALTAQGIRYHNLAVSDAQGRIAVHAPQGRHSGKTSLLLRSETTAYDSFEVETRTLDGFFKGRHEASFFLWVDVEGAAERVLAGAPNVLRQTLAVFVECETYPFWQEGSSAGRVADILLEAGFIPVARDREYGDKQFNVLFVAGRIAHRLAPSLFDASSPIRRCLALSPASDDSIAQRSDGAVSSLPNAGRK